LAACVLLLAVYVALSFANDPQGYLGTDTGGKVATLRAMEHRSGIRPDVGYWAARWDPQGRFHPLSLTTRRGDQWLTVTTLPVLELALPLYRAGGYRLILLLPMVGAVAAAAAARALAGRFGASEAWAAAAFWLAGLASPVAIYALDFWEHSIGLALVAWALVVLVDIVSGRRQPAWGVGAGVLLGAAATLRTEAYVYFAIAAAVSGVALLWRVRRLAPPLVLAITLIVGCGVPLAANAGLEQAAVHGQLRADRTATQAARAPDQAVLVRAREAGLTAVGLHPSERLTAIALGLGLLALLLLLAARGSGVEGDAGLASVACVGIAVVYLLRFAEGLGFVPGLVAAAPLAGVGLAGAWRPVPARPAAIAAVAALPFIWAFQFTGGAEPQWGGRYLLPTMVVLLASGAVVLARLTKPAVTALVVVSVAVTSFGLVWLSVRTRDVARTGRTLAALPDSAVIFRISHVAREEGAFYTPTRKWLTAQSSADEARAARIMVEAGVRRLSVVSIDDRHHDSNLAGYSKVDRRRIHLFSDTPLRITSYEASP
jgi:hypothetical protein